MWGIRGGQSDFKYLSQQLMVMPLFSHAANADRRGDTPTKVNPHLRVRGISRVIPPACYDTLWAGNLIRRPVTPMQVGITWRRVRNYVTYNPSNLGKT